MNRSRSPAPPTISEVRIPLKLLGDPERVFVAAHTTAGRCAAGFDAVGGAGFDRRQVKCGRAERTERDRGMNEASEFALQGKLARFISFCGNFYAS